VGEKKSAYSRRYCPEEEKRNDRKACSVTSKGEGLGLTVKKRRQRKSRGEGDTVDVGFSERREIPLEVRHTIGKGVWLGGASLRQEFVGKSRQAIIIPYFKI